MNSRVLIAGIVGGIVMFIWLSVAHMSPLGQVGFSSLSNDAPALSALRSATGDRDGLYMLPSMDIRAADQGAEMKSWEARAKAGPSGLLIYHPPGRGTGMTPLTLVLEGLNNIVLGVIAAILLSLAAVRGYLRRVAFVALVGLAAVLTTSPSYWLWYGFPADYTLAYMLIDALGYVAGGFAIAAILKPAPAASAKAG